MFESVTKFADHGATQGDRWLFLMLLALLVVGGVLAIRYLVARNDKATDLFQANLQKMIADNNQTQKELAVCLDRNSSVLKDCTDEIRICREQRRNL